MSVHILPDGRWICKFPAGTIPDQPKKVKEYFGRGVEGEKAARKRNAQLGLKTKEPATTAPSFHQAAIDYIEARASTVTEATIKPLTYKVANVLIPALGHHFINRLDYSVLDQYVQSRRAQGVKFVTIRADLCYIHAILQFAKKRGKITHNPIDGYRLPRDDSDEIHPLSQAELQTLVKFSSPHLQRVIWIAYYTACRPGPRELLSLTWKDVDLINQTIMITSARKGGPRQREIPLARKFAAFLQSWKEEDARAGYKGGYLVHYQGQPVTSVKVAWEKAKRRAGITRRLRLYDLRHTSATDMLAAEVDIKTISEILGNTPEQCMRAYLHVSSTRKRNAIDKLGKDG